MVNPQNWNGYAYAINNPIAYVDRNGRWPKSIHDLIIQPSFPGLGFLQIGAMQSGSFYVDCPTTILESHANEHAMRRPGQTLEKAQQGYQAFIDAQSSLADDWIKYAERKKNEGFYEQALNQSFSYFGAAIHPIMDNTSPAHMLFQLYVAPNFTGNFSIDSMLVLVWAMEMREHSAREASISDAQLNGAINVVREHFKKVYGEAAFNRAVSPLFQRAVIRIVDGKPIVKAGNLGTITVRPDGSQDYEGPLTPAKRKRK